MGYGRSVGAVRFGEEQLVLEWVVLWNGISFRLSIAGIYFGRGVMVGA